MSGDEKGTSGTNPQNSHYRDPTGGRRRRSDGVLSNAEIEACRSAGIGLAYDPVQIGWVPLDCENDIVGSCESREFLYQAAGSYRFRRWRETEAGRLSELLSNSDIWRYMPEGHVGPVSVSEAAALIGIANLGEGQSVLAVEYEGNVIGQVRLVFESNMRAVAEISYWLGDRYWGRGHATAMLRAFLHLAFREHVYLSRLTARVHQDNHASARVLEKLHFKPSTSNAEDNNWRWYERGQVVAVR